MADEKKELMAEEKPKEEAKIEEEKKEEKAEQEEEKKEEEMSAVPAEKFSLDAYVDVASTLAFLEAETETNKEMAAEAEKDEEMMACKMAVDELKSKGKDAEFGVFAKGMFALVSRMAKRFAEAEAKSKAYMAENEELKSFRANIEAQQKDFEVAKTLQEVEAAVEMPKAEMEALREDAKNFSLDKIDVWKNAAKAKAFGFAEKGKKESDGLLKIGLPFALGKADEKKSVWDRI